MWVHEIACVTNISILVETFSFYQNMDLYSFRQTFWHDKWDLPEGCGGPNVGEKIFQLFQYYSIRKVFSWS